MERILSSKRIVEHLDLAWLYNAEMPPEPTRFTIRSLLWMTCLLALSLGLMRVSIAGQIYEPIATVLSCVGLGLFFLLACVFVGFFVRGSFVFVIAVFLAGLYLLVCMAAMSPNW